MVDFQAEDRRAREMLRDLQAPRARVYWVDLLVTAVVGWLAFGAAASMPLSPEMFLCAALAALALYRGLSFIHEISHINRSSLRGFERVWNILFGFPLLLPSFTYLGVHQAHHNLSTYGTAGDPEYLPFAQSRRMTIVFALESALIPGILLLRFLVAAPVGLLLAPWVPRVERWLAVHASSVTMNFTWRREVTAELLRKMRRDSMLILLVWGAAIALLPARVFFVWFGVYGAGSFINTLRTLAAHRYEGNGEPFDRRGQLRDSIDTPGAWWTELWAPVGLRYHALHHQFPGLPYHNLAEAHGRLVSVLGSDSIYRASVSHGLLTSLGNLLRLRTRWGRFPICRHEPSAHEGS